MRQSCWTAAFTLTDSCETVDHHADHYEQDSGKTGDTGKTVSKKQDSTKECE